jgi:hypothetical protein
MNRRVHPILVTALLVTAAGCASAATPPTAPAPSASAAQPPSASPTAAPAPSFTPAPRPAPPTVEASDVSAYALLQAGDVDPTYVTKDPYAHPPGEHTDWEFADEWCPGYADLKPYTHLGYSALRGHLLDMEEGDAGHTGVFVEVRRFPSIATARKVMAEVNAVVQTCARYQDARDAPDLPLTNVSTYTVLRRTADTLQLRREIDTFDASGALVGENDMLIAVLRKDDLVTVIRTSRTAPRLINWLATAAAKRLAAGG